MPSQRRLPLPGPVRTLVSILREAGEDYLREDIPRLGAALAFYTLFALAPVLILAISIAGLVFGQEAARGEVVHQIDGLIGTAGARTVEAVLASAGETGRAIPATIIGLLTFLVGATTAFAALQGALNKVWNVGETERGPLRDFARRRLLSFGLVVATGFLLLVSLALSAALAALGGMMEAPFGEGSRLLHALNFLLAFGVTTLLFALIYKVLPDVELAWRDVWIGGIITAFFFSLGKFLIGFYLGRSTVGSSYGAAGSVVVTLVWVYYSAQVVLFGAEVTQAVVRRFGSLAPLPPGQAGA